MIIEQSRATLDLKPREEGKVYLGDYMPGRSPRERRKLLREFYSDTINAGAHNGSNSLFTWRWFINKYKKNFKTGIELGCGQGAGIYGIRQEGFEVWGIDHAFIPEPWKRMDVSRYCCTAELASLPFKDNIFDVVLIPDVLEHIPEEDIPQVLSEMKRVGSNQYYALVAMDMDKGFGGIIFTHITLRDQEWWHRNFALAGFSVKEIDHWDWKKGVRKLGFAMEKS